MCIDNGQLAEREKIKIEIVSAPEIRSAMMRSNVGRKANDEMAARGAMLPNYGLMGSEKLPKMPREGSTE
jgi:hypothetical protein